MAIVGQPYREPKLFTERACKRYLPEGEVRGPDNRAPAVIDGPACRDTDSDRDRTHPGIYLSDEACEVAGDDLRRVAG